MSPPDDIPNDTPPSQSERTVRREGRRARRSVGPESEDRGGPEAVDETLDDSSGRELARPSRNDDQPAC